MNSGETRNFPPRAGQSNRPGRRGLRPGEHRNSHRPCGRRFDHSDRPGRLRRPRDRRGRRRSSRQGRQRQARRHGRRLTRTAWTTRSQSLSRQKDLAGKIDVSPDRKFIGFDAYKQAMDCLKPGDVVIFATPLAFRWVHFTYAIEKGLNVFMEKPLSADGAASQRLLALAEQAAAKNLKVGVGLMSRHARPLQELHDRIAGGEIGDIVLMRGYRMAGPVGTFASPPKPANISDLEYQIRRFHSFLWAGGGCFSDFNIHIIDHLCWMKNAWPVKAQGVGGRHYQAHGRRHAVRRPELRLLRHRIHLRRRHQAPVRRPLHDRGGQDVLQLHPRHQGRRHRLKERRLRTSLQHLQGSGRRCPKTSSGNPLIRASPYQNEWDDLMDAIVNNKPYNEVKRGVEASLVTSMGRMAAHTGQEITFDQMLNSDHEFAPGIDKLTADSPAPVQPDAKGMYPQPEPGRKKREY